MSKPKFQGKIQLTQATQDINDPNVYNVTLIFTDNFGVFSINDVNVGDILLIDTESYETGTITKYRITSIISKDIDTKSANITIRYIITNDNVSIPDLGYSLGYDGVITRPTINRQLLVVPSISVQGLSEKFISVINNHNYDSVIDAIISGGGGSSTGIFVQPTEPTNAPEGSIWINPTDPSGIISGKSAFEIAVDNGFTGTESQWLISLIGPQGPSGPQGPAGTNGAQGPSGPQGQKGDTGAGALPGVIYECDFFNTSSATLAPFERLGIGTGASVVSIDFADYSIHHPGIVAYRSGTTGTSGTRIGTASILPLIPDSTFECILKFKSLSVEGISLGFHDSAGTGPANNGIYFYMATGSSSIAARASASNVHQIADTSFTPLVDVWYKFRIIVNSAGNSVQFIIYDNSNSNAVLYDKTINTGLPTTELAATVNSWTTDTTGTKKYTLIDYLMIYFNITR